MSQRCLIWNTQASVRSTPDDRHVFMVASPRAGGDYRITGQAVHTIKNGAFDDRAKAKLTTQIIDRRPDGEEPPLVDSKLSTESKEAPELPHDERAKRLLRHIEARESESPGDPVRLRFTDPGLLAHSESWHDGQVEALIHHLEEQRWLKVQQQSANSLQCNLTSRGHSHLNDVRDSGDKIDGLDEKTAPWGDYPIDELLIRSETRTVYEVVRRIKQKRYVMDPEFQRDFIWKDDKQSRLIESVIMRIPLPVFYLAEDEEGRMIVVDGLQRLSTFDRFLKNELRLRLPERGELHGKRFRDLAPMIQNRIEDCNLTFYIMDAQVPERARLDIFERVNGGVPLSRQQMRNCLFMGPATQFLRDESRTDVFLDATGRSLRSDTMRDREFVNRFCAFQILGVKRYRGDMEQHLAVILRRMNRMDEEDIGALRRDFRRSLQNNYNVFGKHAFSQASAGTPGGEASSTRRFGT